MSTNKTVGVSGLTSKYIISNKSKDYIREYQYITGINKKFRYFVYFMEEESEYDNEVFKDYKLDNIMKDIKRFLRAQEKGKFKFNLSLIMILIIFQKLKMIYTLIMLLFEIYMIGVNIIMMIVN